MRVFLLTGDKWDTAQKKMLARRCAAKGLILLECSDDSQRLAKELSEFLTSVLEAGITSTTRSAKELLAAYEGFKEALSTDDVFAYSERQDRSITAARWFFSQFVVDPVAAQSLDVLARTSLLWFERIERKDFSQSIAQAAQDLIRLSERSVNDCLQIFKVVHSISKIESTDITPEKFCTDVDSYITSVQLRRAFKQNIEQFIALYGMDHRFELKGAS